MRTTIVIMLMGLSMAAEQPKTPPAAKPEPPKTATVDPDKTKDLEIALDSANKSKRIAELEIAAINTAYAALVTLACQSIGGKVADDCIPLPRQAGQPMTVQLKPVAKAEVKK